MINVSNDFKKRMEESRDFKEYAEITFPDGSQITLDDSQFIANNSYISDGAGLSEFPLGVAVQKLVQFEILNDEEQYKDVQFTGAKIRLYTDFVLDDVNPWVGQNLLLEKGILEYSQDGLTIKYVGDGYFEVKGTYTGTANWSPYLYNFYIASGTIREAGTYTFSCNIERTSTLSLYCNEYSVSNGAWITGNNPPLGKNQSTFLLEDGNELRGVGLTFYPGNTYDLKVRFKLEKGSIATDWALAPEDIRTERIEKGTYTVISPETYGETVIITAYDDMYKADKDYTTNLTFPQTAGAVLRDICSTCDISLGSVTFKHDDFIIQSKPEGKSREVIGYIAMIACGNARIDTKNRLQIMSYDLSGWDYPVNYALGVNVLTGTGTAKTITGNNTTNQASTLYNISSAYVNSFTTSNPTITISFDYEASAGATGTFLYQARTGPSGNYNYFALVTSINVAQRPTGHVVLTYTIPVSILAAGNPYAYFRLDNFVGTLTISNMKWEEGAVDDPIWSPAQGEAANPYFLLNEFTAPKVEYNDTTITGFKAVIQGETSDDDTEILVGDDTYVITVENPLITGQEETVLSWLYETIANVPFRPFSGDAISNPLIEFMDLAKVEDARGNQHNTFVADINFAMPGFTTLSNSTPSMARSELGYSSAAAKVEQKTRQLIEREKTDREMAFEELLERLEHTDGVYTTMETTQSGGKIYYLHNKPTLAESDMVWKMTAEAWGVSTDGGKTWNAGMTVDGDTIVRILNAVGVNADWINTGAITVKDAGGNIIFSVDMDTKQIIISGDSVRIGAKSATQAISDTLTEAKNYSDGKLSDYANAVTKDIENLQAQVDGQIETFYYDYAPTLSNVPASAWTTEDERAKHEGDLFYDKSTGYAYRFFKDGSTWKWQMIQDTDITKALQTAENAQDTADNKRRVFVSTPKPPYDEGDLWTNGTDILTCTVARATGAAYVSTDWKKLNTYTDDTVANEALAEAQKARNLTIILDNEYEGIPTDYEGNYGGTLSVQTKVQTFYGQTDISSSCTYATAKSSGITGSWNNSTRTYTVTALTTDTGWVDITATYATLFTVTKRFNVAKVKGGVPGEQGANYSNNILRKTNVEAPLSATGLWSDGEWASRSGGNGKLSSITVTDCPNADIKVGWQITDNTSGNIFITQYDTPLIKGNIYTISCYARVQSGSAVFCARLGNETTGDVVITPITKTIQNEEWARYSATFVWSVQYNSRVQFGIIGAGDTLEICGMKLELGEAKETVWTPAIEDLQGEDGEPGRTYSIELSANALKRGQNNAVTPATLTASAYYRDGSSATRTAYAGRWIVATSTDGVNFTNVSTSTANEATKSYSVGSLATNIVAVRFTLYAAGGTTTALDMQTVPVLVDIAALSHEQVFNLLTNNGAMKGIYQEGNEIYVNLTYVKTGALVVENNGYRFTLDPSNPNKLIEIAQLLTSTASHPLAWMTKDGFYGGRIQGDIIEADEDMYVNKTINSAGESIRANVFDNLVYRPGDSYTIADFWAGGYLSNSATAAYFHIPLCKPVVPGTKVTVSNISGRVRQNGIYIKGSSSASVTLSADQMVLHEGYIQVRMSGMSGVSGTTNNGEISVEITSATITFS